MDAVIATLEKGIDVCNKAEILVKDDTSRGKVITKDLCSKTRLEFAVVTSKIINLVW